MPDVTILRPTFSLEEAVQLAQTHYNLTVTARTLPSERDQNFHLTAVDGTQYILKIAGLTESPETLALENALITHLNLQLPISNLIPKLVPTANNQTIPKAAASGGTNYPIRLITYLPGKLLAHTKPHSPALLHHLGHTLGQLDAALTHFEHPAAHRDLKWDLKVAGFIADYLQFILDSAQRQLVQGFLDHFLQRTQPRLANLPHSIIHNDANDYNVLTINQKISGIFDFGDALHTATICELAIAAAYAILHKPNPLSAAAHVVGGYHAAHPLSEQEIALLFPLIAMRLCVSVTMSAYQATQEPDNDYLQISAAPAWETLEILAQTSPLLAEATFRHACNWEPVAKSPQVTNWLRENRSWFANVLNTDWKETPTTVFDLTPGSLLLGSLQNPDDTQEFTNLLFTTMTQSGVSQTSYSSVPSVAKIGIGRYDEPRRIYSANAFRIPGNDWDEWRTIHMGIDLFVAAGTAVHAPLPGKIHSFANNTVRLDYGPIIVLQHDVSDDLTFYTLYGHLSEASLDGLTVGQPIAKGQKFAEIGSFPTNGDWPPHLHLQIMCDLLHSHAATNFPGVAAPSQREIWRSLCPDPNLILGIPDDYFPPPARSKDEILALRKKHLGPSLNLSYKNPLHIIRGQGQYLYDANNQPYLDAVNNVPHVGHNHPKVVEAAQRQTAVLNTNTRYLHNNLVEYAARLTATLPEPLSVCYFVCSGSEANELALRLARTHTGQQDLLILDGAYHGNTAALINISSYKFDGPGGAGAPQHVHVLPMPDPYRGLYRGNDEGNGRRYAQHAQEIIEKLQAQGKGIGKPFGIAGFIGEPLLGCGGQIVLPDGYFQALFPIIRAVGGVCIADEVQVGFGRVGSHMWAFETQGVVPDIVTMGKPIGNGHPLAAVVTTPEIAESFANGMEYFNTFGGNPVSCAIGTAVLDVLTREKLQENALVVGNHLLAGLRNLQTQFPLIGDVRGLGLYIGTELVRDPQTLEPAAEEASYIANRMRDKGILISTDGPLHNVLKIKPPLVFTAENADFLVETLGEILEEL
ncbi:aminotransferase class III-fold pyridoxal phosphate-dependent enzyme [Candidatus Leptofilum sp.]|uniref:aminotransferase class III-fold pyridoxal phosphate-dependent enzyme n=1 Tax=Candidatus Leptofilum sp. TaxID=3241576 RepID=UPI003B59356B